MAQVRLERITIEMSCARLLGTRMQLNLPLYSSVISIVKRFRRADEPSDLMAGEPGPFPIPAY